MKPLSIKQPKTILTIILVIFLANFVIVSVVNFGIIKSLPSPLSLDAVLERQKENHDAFAQDMPPLTEEEIAKQAVDHDAFSKQQKPLTDEEIQKQLEDKNNFEKKNNL